MNDSKTCQFCGGEIRFRMIRGICVPLHDASTACVTYGRLGQPDACHQTKCPYCGERVYFVRHNDGAVWFNELGQPWDKHACFLTQLEPAEPVIDATYSIVRIRRVVKYYKDYQADKEAQNYCFAIHMGIARCPDVVWYVIPESSTNLTAEMVPKWNGRYCYYSKAAGELVFFDGSQIVLFTREEV